MSSLRALERFDEAEIEDVCGIDLSHPQAPTMTSLQEAQSLIDTLWDLARVLLKKGSQTEGLQEQKEALKALLRSAEESDVHQSVELMKALDDPELWESFAAEITTAPALKIGGLIKGWVQPQYQLHVALLVGQRAGLFSAGSAVDVSAYVSGLHDLPFQGTLGQAVWPLLQETPLALTLRESTFPSNRAKDISPIGKLTNLTALTLENWLALRNLQPLEHLTRLTALKLTKCTQVRNLSPIGKLTSLTSVDIDSNIRNIRPLQGLTRLTTLRLSDAAVGKLAPLQSLTNLTTLCLQLTSSVRDLSPLQALTGLTSLTLYGAHGVSDLSPLQSLTGLTSLTLYGIRSQSLRPLHELPLEDFHLSRSPSVTAQELQALQAALPGCRISNY